MAQLNSTTLINVTKKGATHNPRPSAMANHLSWQGIADALAAANGKAVTVATLQDAIAQSNPTNQGNARAYINYMVNNGHLAVQSSKAAK